MTIDWTHELADQLDWDWTHHLRPRLETITAEEYLWEPVEGAWSVRPRAEATTAKAAGAGKAVVDFEFPEPDPAPLTTIAWRMAHLVIVLGARAADHFGDGGVHYTTIDWPLDAAAARQLLDHHYDAWTTGVRALDAAGLARPCGPAEGPFADYPFAALVLHINREVIHHGAEICLLRDLYRQRDHYVGGQR
jgi:hypothetical protein